MGKVRIKENIGIRWLARSQFSIKDIGEFKEENGLVFPCWVIMNKYNL